MPEHFPFEANRETRDQRKSGRVRQETMVCSMGRVLDVSAGGMRVLCRRVPRRTVRVTLEDGEAAFRVVAHPVWARQIGFRRYEVGFVFDCPLDEVGRRLWGVSLRTTRLRRVV